MGPKTPEIALLSGLPSGRLRGHVQSARLARVLPVRKGVGSGDGGRWVGSEWRGPVLLGEDPGLAARKHLGSSVLASSDKAWACLSGTVWSSQACCHLNTDQRGTGPYSQPNWPGAVSHAYRAQVLCVLDLKPPGTTDFKSYLGGFSTSASLAKWAGVSHASGRGPRTYPRAQSRTAYIG